MAKPIFYDAQRKRWRRLRRLFDVAALTITLLIVAFAFTVVHGTSLPSLLLPDQRHPYKALKENERQERDRKRAKLRAEQTRKRRAPATQLPLNAGDGVRAAFYVTWDATSFASLRQYEHQIDVLYPEWVHVVTTDGRIQGVSPENKLFNIVNGSSIHQPDDKVMNFLKAAKSEMEVLPMINNFDPTQNKWVEGVGDVFIDPAARMNFRRQLEAFLATESRYRGAILDFEGFPRSAQPGFRALVNEVYTDLHARGMKLHMTVPVADDDFDLAVLSAHSDGIIVMNYDQHFQGGDPGPIAGQEWFTKNLRDAMKVIPKDKLIVAVGSYGYDWYTPKSAKKNQVPEARVISAQEAWLSAHDSEAEIEFDPDSLNPHFAFADDANGRHDVWFLDAVTVLNQMRAADRLGITAYALWRLGGEDRSLWAIWDLPGEPTAPDKIKTVPPGQEVDMEGEGEIMRIATRPSDGQRDVTVDAATGLITDQKVVKLPMPYQIDQYGALPKKVALTFDDGPDPEWTPKILDVLRDKQAKASFFVVGSEAENFPGLTQRIYREGHEIGNHTFTHPDISNISKRYMQVELNLAERLFASLLRVKPILFRPPYSIDQEPDTADQVRPLEIAQDMGYTTVGDKIDPNDWKDNPHTTADQIVAAVIDQLEVPRANMGPGSVVLLHDGGGNRGETVKALPILIDTLRARGYQVVSLHELMGKQFADVMPPISPKEVWSARVDRSAFWLIGLLRYALVLVFFVGDVLMTGRLLIVGALATFDRLRGWKRPEKEGAAGFHPAVAIVIPAYNEGTVIVHTIQAALHSDYHKVRVIVVDDGSTDNTLAVAQKTFAAEVAQGRLVILSKANSGKAEALNYGLTQVEEEIFVGIDADTAIAKDAVSRLVPHFLDSRIGAIAGNAKVGNRVNMWTRWQALEYVTSQNFERRALNVFGAVSVVPGAIGAWRTAAVREAGGFQTDTVAEDADLTMALLERGYRVEYEDQALAYTEAPINANGLMRQRFRWSFGIMQSVWKHGRAFGRKGALGWVALPNIVVFQIMLPLVSPLIDIFFALGVIGYLVDRYYHPETANPATLEKLIAFFMMFLLIDFVASVLAFLLERRRKGSHEDYTLLLHVWLQRFAYRQLFSVVLFKTLKRAAEGRSFAWDKLERTTGAPLVPAEREVPVKAR